MITIPIIVGTARQSGRSLPVAQQIRGRLEDRDKVTTEFLDLGELKLPILEERPETGKYASPGIRSLCESVASSSGILIVAPEYKNGIPGSLKNALDFLPPGALRRKPVGICSVSAGGFGGINCLAQLRLVSLALGGLPIPEFIAVSKVNDLFNESGELQNPAFLEKVDSFIDELVWYCRAIDRHRCASA